MCWQAAHASSPQSVNRMSDVYPITPSVQRSHSNAGINARRHVFEQKKIYNFVACGPCGIKARWGKILYKCRDCRATAHPDCKDRVPLPCIGLGSVRSTPGKTVQHVLADFTPVHSPMVPGLIVHCINEIEKRGMTEVGLYRVPGSEREVKELKERFLKGKGCPILARIDVHVLCGCVKDFLRSLREPIIPHSMWLEFVQATGNPDQTDGDAATYQAISKLPPPNRDTLAYIILHLQRVAERKENLMNVSNLAKILGPTIIGYSSPNPLPASLVSELGNMTVAMERLLELEMDYWNKYIDVEEGENLFPRNNILSPYTPELLEPIVRDTGLTPTTTPLSSRGKFGNGSETKQYFHTPMLQ
jgi:Rac GTPase-activating protein 1